MKKITTLTLLMIFLVTMIFPVKSIKAITTENNGGDFSISNAVSNVTESKINLELTNWVLDESGNTLYAISSTEKKLLFINAQTLAVENSLNLNGNPSDIIKEDGSLYVALGDVNQIAVVDIATRKTTNTLYTSSDAYRILKNGNKIYYSEYDQWCNIYEYDIDSNKDKVLPLGSLYNPDLAINKEKNILYIGESGTSACDMIYYSLSENKVLSKSNYNHGLGFPYATRSMLFDGENVFFAGRNFDAVSANRIHGDFGDFGKRDGIIFIKDDLIYTNKSIYSKSTHIKLGESNFNMKLIESSSNTVYIYNNDTKSITRYNDLNKIINSSNVIELISGTASPKIQSDTESVKVNTETYALDMKSKLTEWILDEPSNTLYGISKDDKALFFMNSKTLNIEKSISFTSNPTDIIKDGSTLYIALDDINQIAIVDIATRKTIQTLYTTSDPYRIIKNGDKLYYTERDQWCNIYEYDMVKNIDKILPVGRLYSPDIAINKEKNILYIGESGLSGSNMVYYSITDNKIISKSNYNNGYGFSYPERSILFDGVNVFYAGRNFKDDNATRILGKYSDDTIIYTTDEFVFTKKSIYDKNDYSLISNFDFELNLAAQSSKYDLYFYNEQNKVVMKIEPDITAPVVEGVKNDGIYYGNVTISFNEGTASLDGKAFTMGETVTEIGVHTLEVVDASGNITVVRFTIVDYKKEDVNKDGIVDKVDMSMISLEYNKTNKDSNWNDSLDINKDGIIDIFDIVLVGKNIE